MSTKVKVGLSQSGRELEVEVGDADEFMREFEAMLSNGKKLWWVTDEQGNRHGLVIERIAYVEVAPSRDRKLGFG